MPEDDYYEIKIIGSIGLTEQEIFDYYHSLCEQ